MGNIKMGKENTIIIQVKSKDFKKWITGEMKKRKIKILNKKEGVVQG